ncbi:hypothetical protein SESBI_07209 [Sesbania bispinosa]|nr:hypothetical protein SESBI_07209 [Sesbania bispinosa]
MSFAAYKMMSWPTGVDNCASGFLTHSRADLATRIIPPLNPDDDDWAPPRPRDLPPLPNLVITCANLLEIYHVRIQDQPPKAAADSRRATLLDGIAGASLELVCHYRLHGNVESMAVLSVGGGDTSRRRDSIILTFKDAKISVLEYDDSIHGLRTSYVLNGALFGSALLQAEN